MRRGRPLESLQGLRWKTRCSSVQTATRNRAKLLRRVAHAVEPCSGRVRGLRRPWIMRTRHSPGRRLPERSGLVQSVEASHSGRRLMTRHHRAWLVPLASMRWTASCRCRQVFVNAEVVSLGVLEPGGLFGTEHTDVVHRLQSGKSSSSKATPARARTSMVATMSPTRKLMAVWSALVPSGFGNSAKVPPPTELIPPWLTPSAPATAALRSC